MRWAERQRMAFIDEVVSTKGALNRSDLMTKFGISLSQASVDIAKWRELHPGRLVYDPLAKCYVPT